MPEEATRTEALASPIGGPAAWRGAELGRSGWWPRRLSATEIAAIDAALAAARDRGATPPLMRGTDFPIDPLRPLLDGIARELEDGTGIVRLSGLPVWRYAPDDLRRVFWGLCANIGTPLYQTAAGEVLGEVKDESGIGRAVTGSGLGPVPSARARSRSTGPLRWHTDKCDVLALLCASNGIEGGISKVASTVAVHDEMLRRAPDLLRVLFSDYWRLRPADEAGEAPSARLFPLPVFARNPAAGGVSGGFTSQYSRTYVELAQEVPEVARLTRDQVAALDLLAEIAEELHAAAAFAPGDIQFLNQHVSYHGRTAYADDAARGTHRVLLRIWLATPNSRALPAGHREYWGDVRPGALRGGMIVGRSAIAA